MTSVVFCSAGFRRPGSLCIPPGGRLERGPFEWPDYRVALQASIERPPALEAWSLFFGGLERLGPMTGARLGRRGHPKARTWGEVNPSWGHLTPKEGEAIPPPPPQGPTVPLEISWPPRPLWRARGPRRRRPQPNGDLSRSGGARVRSLEGSSRGPPPPPPVPRPRLCSLLPGWLVERWPVVCAQDLLLLWRFAQRRRRPPGAAGPRSGPGRSTRSSPSPRPTTRRRGRRGCRRT